MDLASPAVSGTPVYANGLNVVTITCALFSSISMYFTSDFLKYKIYDKELEFLFLFEQTLLHIAVPHIKGEANSIGKLRRLPRLCRLLQYHTL